MLFGLLAVALALVGTLLSTGAYFRWMLAERRAEAGIRLDADALAQAEARYASLARWGFALSFVMLLLAILQVETAAYRHDFSLSYIARFSSRDEPKDYLFATLWAGQEGTFLLWCTYITLLGLIVRRYARNWEPSVMFFLNLIRLSLLIVLVGKSPFAPTPQMLPAALQAAGISTFQHSIWAFLHPGGLNFAQLPADGQGLNPLLQNKWMRIHPPTLFFGFAATAIPFAFAMAALWKKEYETWVRRSLPWAALAFTVLGGGIMMGGYWAYAVLGWGGFWGWDPVENSSKVPWLMCVLLLHGMLMQQRRDTWHRTVVLLGMLPFLMVMFSSFLTRSGILENFSVHSFAKEDDLFPYLIGPLCFFWLMGVGTWLARWKTFPSRPDEPKPFTVPAMLHWTLGVVGLFAFLVWAGMSSPLLTGIAAGLRERAPFLTFLPSATSNVTQGYYNFIATPIAILAAILMAFVPLLSWRDTDLRRNWPKILTPLTLALFVIAMAIMWGVGRNRPPYELWSWGAGAERYRLVLPAAVPLLSLIFAGSMAVFSSLQVLFRAPKKVGRLGGYLSHAGIGVLLIGVVTAELSGGSQKAGLVKGEAQKVMGYSVLYRGLIPTPDGKTALDLTFTNLRRDETFKAPAPVYFSQQTQQTMVAPYIHKYPGMDLYIAPEGRPMSSADMAKREVELQAGQSSDLVNGVSVRFDRFEVKRQPEQIRVSALLTVTRGGQTEVITPGWEADIHEQQKRNLVARTKDGAVSAEIEDLVAETRAVKLVMGGAALGEPTGPPQEIALISVSAKPMINLVWLATLMVVCGGLLSVRRAFSEMHRGEPHPRGDYAERGERLMGEESASGEAAASPSATPRLEEALIRAQSKGA